MFAGSCNFTAPENLKSVRQQDYIDFKNSQHLFLLENFLKISKIC